MLRAARHRQGGGDNGFWLVISTSPVLVRGLRRIQKWASSRRAGRKEPLKFVKPRLPRWCSAAPHGVAGYFHQRPGSDTVNSRTLKRVPGPAQSGSLTEPPTPRPQVGTSGNDRRPEVWVLSAVESSSTPNCSIRSLRCCRHTHQALDGAAPRSGGCQRHPSERVRRISGLAADVRIVRYSGLPRGISPDSSTVSSLQACAPAASDAFEDGTVISPSGCRPRIHDLPLAGHLPGRSPRTCFQPMNGHALRIRRFWDR